MACLLAVCACVPSLAGADMPIYEGPGWDAPEEAVTFYLEGLRTQDISKMIGAYAVETYIDHFDLQAQFTRYTAYTVYMTPRLPNASELLRAINVEARKDEIVDSILLQMTSICMPDEDLSETISFGTEHLDAETQAFIDKLSDGYTAVDFSTLELLAFIPPEEVNDVYSTEHSQKVIEAQSNIYGADEMRSVVAVFAVDGRMCALYCDVTRYDDLWYLCRANGFMGSLMGLRITTGGVAILDQGTLSQLLESLDEE